MIERLRMRSLDLFGISGIGLGIAVVIWGDEPLNYPTRILACTALLSLLLTFVFWIIKLAQE